MIPWHREALVWAAVVVSFPIVALLEPGSAASAVARAESVARWESLVGLDIGADLASGADRLAAIGAFASFVYYAAHVPAAVGTFVWLGVRHPHGYLAVRRVFVVAHLLTIACYVLLPTAPPRLVPSLGGEDPAAERAGWHTLQYEFAAMPSGHVIVAAIVGVAMVRYGRGALRVLGVIYPALILVVTMSTRNHFVTDGLLGLVIVAVSLETVRLMAGRAWGRAIDWRVLGSGSAPQSQRMNPAFETRGHHVVHQQGHPGPDRSRLGRHRRSADLPAVADRRRGDP